MLQKLGIKYLAVYENQGKLYKLRMMKKKMGRDDAKKEKD